MRFAITKIKVQDKKEIITFLTREISHFLMSLEPKEFEVCRNLILSLINLIQNAINSGNSFVEVNIQNQNENPFFGSIVPKICSLCTHRIPFSKGLTNSAKTLMAAVEAIKKPLHRGPVATRPDPRTKRADLRPKRPDPHFKQSVAGPDPGPETMSYQAPAPPTPKSVVVPQIIRPAPFAPAQSAMNAATTLCDICGDPGEEDTSGSFCNKHLRWKIRIDRKLVKLKELKQVRFYFSQSEISGGFLNKGGACAAICIVWLICVKGNNKEDGFNIGNLRELIKHKKATADSEDRQYFHLRERIQEISSIYYDGTLDLDAILTFENMYGLTRMLPIPFYRTRHETGKYNHDTVDLFRSDPFDLDKSLSNFYGF